MAGPWGDEDGGGGLRAAHRDDAVAVLHPAVPGAQPHALLPELGAHTGLGGKEHGVGEQAVRLPQGGLGRSQEIQVPVDSDAVNVPRCLRVCQHLRGEGDGTAEPAPCTEGSGRGTRETGGG